MKRGGNKRKSWKIAYVTLIALLITLLITAGTAQNVTELNATLPIPENVSERNGTQLESITDLTAPKITIRAPLNTTYNTTAIRLNYSISEPPDWVGYSLNRADNVTIIDNITFNARVGFNEVVVYATDSAGNLGKAEVQFTVNLTEPLTITPKSRLKLTKEKECFALDEEPEFIVEYAGEEEMRGIAAESVTIDAFAYGPYGELTDIEIEKRGENNFSVKIPRERAFRAGLYKLRVKLVKDELVYMVEKEFQWGLVSLNTKKSIYKPGETAEFIIVVLDKEGHSVCNADISMTITNPNNERRVYSTDNSTILPGEECGLYHADYLTEVEGNHTIDLVALISGIEVNFSTNFSVKQDYEFDIIREAQSKIDPTRQDWFYVTINVESFTGATSVTIKEFVPAAFDISADAAAVLIGDGTKTLTWNKDLIDGRTSVNYSYSVPHVWPYLYALGPVEIDYNGKTFREARAWYVAVDPPADMFETGIVEANGWTPVNLKRPYNEAIVVARPREGYETSADHEIATAIITNITSNSFWVQLRNESATIKGNVSYIVVENGSHSLANGMLLQAGRFEPVNYYDANGESASSWNSINFHTPYESAPVVIASPNDDSADDWVSVRYDSGSLTTSGVNICLELDCDGGTRTAPVAASPANSIGWIAMNRTNATNMEAWLESAVDEDPTAGDWRTLIFSNNYTTPLFFAMQEETSATDPCTVGMQNLAPGGVDIRLAEERTDGEQTHGTEDVLWMVFESYLGNSTPTSPTGITCNGGSCNLTIDTHVILKASGSTDADNDNITYFIEAALENISTSDDQELGEIQYKAEYASPEYGFKVYHEQFTWSSGTSTYRSIGATVNTSNAFLILYSAAASANPDIWQITGYIYNSTHLLFERADTGTAEVSWFVIECFGEEFTVQRGSIDINSGSTSNTSTISSVNTSRSMVVGQGRVNSASAVVADSQDGYATLELQNSTTVNATRASGATGVAATCRYEVVEFAQSSNIAIQTAETTLSSTNPWNVNINSVNQSSSWLYHTWDASNNGLQQTSVYGQIINDTAIQFGRYSSTSYTNRIRWYVIYHSNNETSVTRDNYNWNPQSSGTNNRDNAISPAVNKSHTFLMHSSSTSGAGTAFARNKNLPYFYDNPNPGDNWRETQYYGDGTGTADQHETRCQIVTLPYSAGSGADDTEATKEWTTYTDVIASAWKNITQINVTVYVSGYNNSGSIQNGNNNPDLQLELATADGNGWTAIGNFSISGIGNVTLVTNESAIENAWLTPVNRDARIRGIDFDYNNSLNIDQINYMNVWVTLEGKKWTEIGNHSESSDFIWNTTDIAEQTCVDLRGRAIDLEGSNSYSNYYTKGCCLNIKRNFVTIPEVTVYDATADVDTENWINFTIEDPNTMDDIKNITVELWYANSTAYPYKAASNNNRSYYLFKWNETGDDLWHCALDDAYVNISGHITEAMKPSGTKTWQWVNLSFKLNETAVPSGTGTQWNVSVTAYSIAGSDGRALNATSFDVNKYVSAATQEAGVNLGTVAPEAQTSTVSTTISFTSNAQVEINVTGADLTSGSESIGYANFYYTATDSTEGGSGSAIALTGTAQVAYASYDAVEDSLNTAITGWNYQINPALAFNGTIPVPQIVGIYTGVWNIGFVATTPA